MILELYSIKDQLNDYAFPIPFVDQKQAIRYFKDQCNGGNQFIQRNKEDFILVYMGKFNANTGIIEQDEIKEIIKGEDI